MTLLRLVILTLRFRIRSHAGVVLAAFIGSAVLTGALLVGDSVRGSLADMAASRLGRVTLALSSGDRFFRAALARSLEDPLDTVVASVLQLPATAALPDGARQVNHVQFLGVDARFWLMARDGRGLEQGNLPGPDEVWLNDALARGLGVRSGEVVILRVPKPSAFSRDAPISPREDTSIGLRLTVARIVQPAEFGRFSLQASQLPAANAFVNLAWAQERLGLAGKANLLLVRGSDSVTGLEAETALRRHWTLDDAGIEWIAPPAQSRAGPELRTARVFLDPPVVREALRIVPDATPILTYLVNGIAKASAPGGVSNATPYSMVTAAGPPLVPADLKPDEILLTPWLAEDLQSKPGDSVTLTYYQVGVSRRLEERSAQFRVRAILPETGPHADPTLMPDFPGLSKARSCREWDAGFPLDLTRVRDKDNQWWENRKGTPKALLSIQAGQSLWTNRFGVLTAIRFPPGTVRSNVAARLLQTLDPATLGLTFEPVGIRAAAAVAGSQDFSGLFIGFSFFLIGAALILVALMFRLALEQRAGELGLLLAVGWPPQQLRRLLWLEGAFLGVMGSVPGALAGEGYARLMIHGLSTLWQDAVAGVALSYHAAPFTPVVGALSAWAAALLALGVGLHQLTRAPARELLGIGVSGGAPITTAPRRLLPWIAGICSGLALALAAVSITEKTPNPALFFASGALLLCGCLTFCGWLLDRRAMVCSTAPPTLAGLAIRNLARSRARSLAVISMLASGSFLVVAVGTQRLEVHTAKSIRSSGTGGFALIGSTSLPVHADLNSTQDREFLGFGSKDLEGVDIVPLRILEGEEASCLNLNRAQKPRVAGVAAAALDRRGAFSFAQLWRKSNAAHPWLALTQTDGLAADEIPAIGDAASIQWALGRSVGDLLEYPDDTGRPFKLRLVGALAGSVLQGSLLVDESRFATRFPGSGGYRMFLVDAPDSRQQEVRNVLGRTLRDYGVEWIPATERLAALNAVQNTYLGTFQILGGLGVVLGTLGLGVVLLRNVLERRAELALLQAVGWTSNGILKLVFTEHVALLALGLASGLLAAVVAVLPPLLLHQGRGTSWTPLVLILCCVGGAGTLSVLASLRFALRGPLLAPLREL